LADNQILEFMAEDNTLNYNFKDITIKWVIYLLNHAMESDNIHRPASIKQSNRTSGSGAIYAPFPVS